MYAMGCGDTVTETEADPDDSGPGAQPPDKKEDAPAGDGPGATLAVDELFLGDTDRSGSKNPSAWKDYGYNLDGKITNCKGSECNDVSGMCKPNAGGSPSAIYPDGNDGVDNAFGKILLPIIVGLAQDAGQQVNEAINDGNFTILMDIEGLGSGPDYVDLHTRLYAGVQIVDDAGNDIAPNWDGMDMWPVAPELLDDPNDISSSQVQFPTAYVSDHTWVSGTPGTLDLSLGVAGFTLTLQITNALISMEIDGSRGSASNGIIAGVIPVEPLIEELRKVAGSFDTGLCSGTTFDSLADQIRAASDIMSDGTQDANATCDSISIGLGFNAGAVLIGDVADPTPEEEDPCDEEPAGGSGGTGGSGGSGGGGGS